MEYTFDNLNEASIILCKELLVKGVKRGTRGTKRVEFPEPVLIHITNPNDRYITIDERKNSKILPFAESLALASGVNDMGLYSGYVKSMEKYSDDGQFQRAGYGPRIRAFTGSDSQYKISEPESRGVFSGNIKVTDQLKYIIETLQKDIYSLQAVITISDPSKDCFNEKGELLDTVDQPCSRSLQFTVVDGKLDCTLYIRSNDLLFGMQAVNIFNFTFMQEYVALILGIPVGVYHHFANSLHYYEDKIELMKTLANLNPSKYPSEFGKWEYPNDKPMSFEEWDREVTKLFHFEKIIRETREVPEVEFFHPLFQDWAKVFLNKWDKSGKYYTFQNPYLNRLFKFDMKLRINNLTKYTINNSRQQLGKNKDVVAVEQVGKVFFQDTFTTNPTVYMDSILRNKGQQSRYLGRTDSEGYLHFKG